ncbi:hypothetical protein [Variovorax sp.]|uniref:hypothetical protein n=1 Tax=Variovorax sp. TaxID=1871043 RepID=UPI002D634FE2|nr:hypothetical protein [Variovorax sp.]HYP83815.1 hypothetical protein [Variovorax sp.]
MFPRRIALTVEQPRAGSYFWVLHEDVLGSGRYEKMSNAAQPRESYVQALTDGYGMLQRISGREDGLQRLRDSDMLQAA